jgi:hypothetical protein
VTASRSPRIDLDGRDWADSLVFSSYRLHIGLRISAAGLLPDLLDLLPPRWIPGREDRTERVYSVLAPSAKGRLGGRAFYGLYAGDERIVRTRMWEQVLGAFESDVRLYVSQFAPRRIFVHAGVVGWKGKAIVIPGRSFSGKSTLVSALLDLGADYYSDEFAVLDPAGRVHPYPAPLALRKPSGSPWKRVRADELGVTVGRKPIDVGAVFVGRYRQGARWAPKRLTGGLGTLELLDNVIPARTRPKESLATLNNAIRGAVILKGNRGDAARAARRLLDHLAESPEYSARAAE